MTAPRAATIRDETDLIQTYLAPLAAPGAFGLEDDAALIETSVDIDLVATCDPIIAGVHFYADDTPADIAWKALAVNVSDLAAKGAAPYAYTMALAFPEAPTRAWMADFSAGLKAAQAAFGCQLIGGDTDRTPGPLSIAITALGQVPRGRFVRRTTARPGDAVFVTGTLGDAALGLDVRRGAAWCAALSDAARDQLRARYLRPQPRLAFAGVMQRYASAALDVSDGLLKDAARLAGGAQARLTIKVDDLPLSPAARAARDLELAALDAIVSGGDDYEILCAVAAEAVPEFEAASARLPFAVTRLGTFEAGSGVALLTRDGSPFQTPRNGFDHFRVV